LHIIEHHSCPLLRDSSFSISIWGVELRWGSVGSAYSVAQTLSRCTQQHVFLIPSQAIIGRYSIHMYIVVDAGFLNVALSGHCHFRKMQNPAKVRGILAATTRAYLGCRYVVCLFGDTLVALLHLFFTACVSTSSAYTSLR
jgi:hypothetical protein